ncbi:hypothetical protein OPV22_005078 [Ensete ventricosum]|uniref:Uncharacterized protein n=1 Tax=Ensete ventricosum TaxID=4639 RepID=A0AAV8Q0B2_ENSVE|nr:hypothetical protein OPV22_005078 [Ensete ventricosum]
MVRTDLDDYNCIKTDKILIGSGLAQATVSSAMGTRICKQKHVQASSWIVEAMHFLSRPFQTALLQPLQAPKESKLNLKNVKGLNKGVYFVAENSSSKEQECAGERDSTTAKAIISMMKEAEQNASKNIFALPGVPWFGQKKAPGLIGFRFWPDGGNAVDGLIGFV